MAGDFPSASEADWERLAGKGKANGVADLRSRSLDGMPVGPIRPSGTGPVLAMRPPGAPWTVVQRVDGGRRDEARAAIAAAVAGGATGIEIVADSSAAAYGRGIDISTDVADLVRDIELPVRIDAGPETPRLVEALGRERVDAAYDPLSTLAAGRATLPVEDAYAAIARLIAGGHATTAFAADGRLWHNGGATEVQELGIALASAVASLRLLAGHDCPPATAARHLGVILAADADQFLTMGKFRAMRLLLARLGEVAGLAARPPIHAETSWRMLGAREPTMNLVRATTAAFAAGTGGADSITVLSPLLDDAAFSDRMARNVQTILIEESSLPRAADPGAGSGAVEDLTERLAAAAWELFTGIEGEGGLPAAIRSGSIARAVAASRDARREAVARRRMPIVGVNVNVDPGVPPATTADDTPGPGLLAAQRLAAPIEALAARAGGERIGVFRMADAADPGLRDALAALGFTVVPLAEPQDAATDAATDPPRIACIVAGDGPLDEAGATARSLRAAGVGTVVLVSGSHEAPGEAFTTAAAPDADLVTLFHGLLDRIADRQENRQVSKRGEQGRES